MPSRALPNLGLKAFFTAGEDNWGSDIDQNFLKLSALVQAGATNMVTTLPTSPAQGSVYIMSSAAGTRANEVAVFDNNFWNYFVPSEGWVLFNRATDVFQIFNGTQWVALPLASLLELSERDIGDAETTSLIDRAAGDARYAPALHNHADTSVTSFNTRVGDVTLTAADITATGFVNGIPSFNGRTGAITLTTADIAALTLSLTNIDDFPTNYTGAGSKYLRVNFDETGVEFADPNSPFPIEVDTNFNLNEFTVGKHIFFTANTPVTLGVLANSTVNLPLGSKVTISQLGTGVVTIARETGVSIKTPADRVREIAHQYGVVTLVQHAINQWQLYGDLSEAELLNASSIQVSGDSTLYTADSA